MDVIKDFELGELPDGSFQLGLRYADGSSRVGIVSPDLLASMLVTLMTAIPQAKDANVKKWAQALTIREVSGRVEHGLATLTYELEGAQDVRLTSTIPADCATALSQALAAATIDPSKH
jgi:hypothetical protein